MPFYVYRAYGLFWNGIGCVDNVPITKYLILDDALAPFTFQALYRAPAGACNLANYQFNLRDKNNAFAAPYDEVFNLKLGSFTGGFAGNFGGTGVLTLTKLNSVNDPGTATKWSCVDGNCQQVVVGPFTTLASCQASCRSLSGEPCNCPPPSVCVNIDQQRAIERALKTALERIG